MRFLRDESGATAAEYVLIVALIGVTVAVAAGTFGQSMAAALGNAGTALGDAASG